MGANNLYRVTYHFEKGGKRCSDTFQDNVIAADSTYNSISTVLTNNAKTNNGVGTLVVAGVEHLSATALS